MSRVIALRQGPALERGYQRVLDATRPGSTQRDQTAPQHTPQWGALPAILAGPVACRAAGAAVPPALQRPGRLVERNT